LASVYAMKPRLVMMDEPDSGVDIDSIQNIFTVIQELKKDGATVILITHSPEVLKQADHAFLLCAGQIIDKGTMENMYDYFNGRCAPCNHIGNPIIDSQLGAINKMAEKTIDTKDLSKARNGMSL